jgi:dehydrogenase/reductase SDR family protein 1
VSTERDLGENSDATIEATCEAINAAGGLGIPVRCDASNDDDIASLLAKVKKEQGWLDVLVCSAFTAPPQLKDATFRDDFWKQGSEMWDACHNVGLRGSYITACESAPLLIETAEKNAQLFGEDSRRPLIVLVSSFGGVSYTFNVAYGVGKAATDRLASDMHVQVRADTEYLKWCIVSHVCFVPQLKKHGVDTVALYPGIVKTEGNLAMDERGEWEAASGGEGD